MEAAYALYRPLYVIAGWDDPLNTGRGLGSAWVGAGLWLDLASPDKAQHTAGDGGGARPTR
jgi:hypothetical protein